MAVGVYFKSDGVEYVDTAVVWLYQPPTFKDVDRVHILISDVIALTQLHLLDVANGLSEIISDDPHYTVEADCGVMNSRSTKVNINYPIMYITVYNS